MDKQHASIPLLYDLDGSVIRSYGIAFELPDFLRPMYSSLGFPDANPNTGWLLPVPATYVVDQDGIVLDILYLTPPVFNTSPPDPNYSQRRDLNADGAINILDILLLTPPVFNTSCVP